MSSLSPSRSERLQALRAEVRAIESVGSRGERDCLAFGLDAIDRRLAGGGLAVPALHEVAAAQPRLGDDAAATLFIAGIAARLAAQKEGGTILWALSRRDLFAPALAQTGLGPDRILYAECRNDEEVLAVMEEGLRHGGLAGVIGEVGRVAMASTRRLQLASEEEGTAALMLKRWRKSGEDPLVVPSAAVTRWRIGCVPSGALPVEGVGRPRWHVELARQRGGEPFNLVLEGTDAEGRLALPAKPRNRSLAADRAKRAA